MKRWQRIVLWIVGGLVALLALAAAGFLIWALNPQGPEAEAAAAMNGSELVRVSENAGAIVFEPRSAEPTAGVVFYQGGHVAPESYAPIARDVAVRGYLAAIVRSPLNFAFFDTGAAKDVISAYPQVSTWVLAGHSLGGVAAAIYTDDNPGDVDGLVLLAAYPAGGGDLSDQALPTVVLRGSNDGLVSEAEIADGLTRLPSDTISRTLVGGNHAQFGDYGAQRGDNPATMPAREQQAYATGYLVEAIRAAQEQPAP